MLTIITVYLINTAHYSGIFYIYFERALIFNNVFVINYFDNIKTNTVILLVCRFNSVLLL